MKRLEHVNVLVVDDVPANAIALAQLLETLGARASTAFTAADAIRLAQSDRFDVFICDIVMRDMDGYRLLAALRATDLNRRTPGIAHTGHDDPEVHDAALAAGYARVLTKPCGMDMFVDTIRALCAP